jgi:formate hydrogenlyase subunit 3/multisubunit Na+/H+ antiporter MnhD subunit
MDGRLANLFAKIALTTGSALVAGALLVIAYLAAGTFILAGFLSAVFLIGEKTDVVQYVFAPIAFSAVLVFAAASWALGALGIGAWWLWKQKRRDEPGAPPQR